MTRNNQPATRMACEARSVCCHPVGRKRQVALRKCDENHEVRPCVNLDNFNRYQQIRQIEGLN
eukprot:scaffold1869_cov122-Cylindrotheca_fusiformis.AAC.25